MMKVWNLVAGHHDVLPHHLRHVHDPLGHRAVGARVRRRTTSWRCCSSSSWRAAGRVQLRAASSTACRSCARASEFDSFFSREFAFLLNNWILLACAFFVLFATMFPTISRRDRRRASRSAPPFFNQWMMPIGLTLLFLAGVGPLLAWRKTTREPASARSSWSRSARVAVHHRLRWRLRRRALARDARAIVRRARCTLPVGADLLRRCARSCSAPSRRSSGAARACAQAQTGSTPFTSLVGLVTLDKRRNTAATSCTSASR